MSTKRLGDRQDLHELGREIKVIVLGPKPSGKANQIQGLRGALKHLKSLEVGKINSRPGIALTMGRLA